MASVLVACCRYGKSPSLYARAAVLAQVPVVMLEEKTHLLLGSATERVIEQLSGFLVNCACAR